MKRAYVFILSINIAVLATAQISLPQIFSDHMILQRDVDIPVWGKASPNTAITVTLNNASVETTSDEQGEWLVHLPRQKAGGSCELMVSERGKDSPSIVFKDVLIGDVWFASGQSNMEWHVQQADGADTEIPRAANPQIRFIKIEHRKSLEPLEDIPPAEWKVCDSTTVRDMSAVAYYFVKRLEADLDIPVGFIQSTWGGTPVEAWTSREMLLSEPHVRGRVLLYDTITLDNFIKDSLDLITFWDIVYNPKNGTDTIIPKPGYHAKNWEEVSIPGSIREWEPEFYEGMIWLRKSINLSEAFTGQDLSINLGYPEMNYSLYFNGEEICKTMWNANLTHNYTIPASVIQKGKNTISIRMAALWGGGALNPPGEEIYLTNHQDTLYLSGKWQYKKDLEPEIPKIYNYHYYPAYLYNAMIHPVIPYGIKGFIWYQGEANDTAAYAYRQLLPLMINDWRIRWQQGYLPFLYVQLPNFMERKDNPSDGFWAVMRESQSETLHVFNTGMSCIIDLGEAGNIHPKNKIDVGNRLAAVAEKQVYGKNTIASGPVYAGFRVEGSKVRLSFSETGTGLGTTDKLPPKGFTVAGEDQTFYRADAIIEGDKLILSADKVKSPVAVRYAWADNPEVNLINSEKLPAVPFRTDTWKVMSQK